MEIGGAAYTAHGGVHQVFERVGTLLVCGADAIARDPDGFVAEFGVDAVVCLLSDDELGQRPDYAVWLAASERCATRRLPTDERGVADDDAVVDLVRGIGSDLSSAGARAVVHCNSGWGRAGLIAALVMCADGMAIDPALRDLRIARPGAGPQGMAQDLQLDRLAERVAQPSP